MKTFVINTFFTYTVHVKSITVHTHAYMASKRVNVNSVQVRGGAENTMQLCTAHQYLFKSANTWRKVGEGGGRGIF